MTLSRDWTILLCIACYTALCLGVGIWALRRTHSAKDFFMAGRDLGILVTGFAVFSSTMSGFGFVGGPGLVYRLGMSSVWMVVASSMGMCIGFFLLSKRLRLLAEVRDSISLPDAVAARYNSELSRFLTALAIILGVIGYLGTQIRAMAIVLRDLLATNPSIPALSLEWCMILSCTILVFYCVTGGVIAGVYTDVIQAGVMMIGGVLIFFAAASAVPGGMSGAVTTIMMDDPEAMGPWGTLGMFGALSWFFLFAMGGSGQPHAITKMMMNKRVSDAKFILPVSILSYALSALLWISIGLAMRALVLQGIHPELGAPDDAAPQFLQHYVNPLLAGTVFAGLFAA
ncbi:MAG: sodium/proline symporter, partial [bacterium]|nr:sodium/proline symporter [bacterium]